LLAIGPVHLGDFPAKDATVVLHNIFPEALQKFVGVDPYFRVFFLFLSAAAEPETQNGQAANYGPAGLPISSQTSSESAHRFHNGLVAFPQLFLPDRKNSLASMEAFHQPLNRLLPHFFRCHVNLLKGTVFFL
jgi:hypothetical protein